MELRYVLTEQQIKNLLPRGCIGVECDDCPIELDSKLCHYLIKLL